MDGANVPADAAYHSARSAADHYDPFILRMGNILNVGYEKILLLYNASTYDVADVISTYTYRLSFPTSGTPMYSKSTAIGLFNTLVNVVFLLVTNAISKRSTESSLF
ncbi:MAG: hypothetical protein ACLUOI_33055 [Eisenbergiella sp.]